MSSLYIGYALAVGKGKSEDIIEAFLDVYPQQKDTIMTAARQLERRGMERGIEKGRQEVARNMLVKLRLDIDTVQKATELNKEELQKILKAGSAISKGN
jgi:predicted transposase/invertase (TIGR01784 family)